MSLSIEETIAELANGDQPLLNSWLVNLSNLNSADLECLEQTWVTIEPKRRWQIINRLVELAEDNFELNFDSIFRNRLTDHDAEVRRKAIEGLWENEEASLINPLIELLELDSSEKVQAAAATALGKFAMLAEFKKLRSCHASRVCQVLLTVINDKSKPVEVRHRALEAVASFSLPQVKKAIMAAYQNDHSKSKVRAIYAMGKNCDRSWLPMLLTELGSANSEIRYEAAGACGELGEKRAVPHLIKLIDDADADVQFAAIQALGKIGGSEVKGCLQQCLNNADEIIRQAAEQALYELEAEGDPLSFRLT